MARAFAVMERSRRTIGLSAKGKALAAFADLKQNSLKRSEQYQLEEEGDVYEDVDETTYQELVKKRREDNFIEDDDGTGAYVDFGQEDWDDAQYSGDENEAQHKRAKGAAGKKATGIFNNLAPKRKNKATERISSMFLKGSGRDVLGASSKGIGKGGTDGDDALIDSLIGEIEHDPLNMSTATSFKRGLVGTGAQRPSMPAFRPTQARAGGAAAAHAETADYGAAPPRFSAVDDEEAAEVAVAGGGGTRALWKDVLESAPRRQLDDVAAAEPGLGFAPMEEDVETLPVADDKETPSDGAIVREEEEEEEGGARRAPCVVPFKAELEDGGGMDWFQVVDNEAEAADDKGVAAPPPEAAHLSTEGALPPLEADGSLRMFWMDAYEDPLNAPGSVFIFGKVGYMDDAPDMDGAPKNDDTPNESRTPMSQPPPPPNPISICPGAHRIRARLLRRHAPPARAQRLRAPSRTQPRHRRAGDAHRRIRGGEAALQAPQGAQVALQARRAQVRLRGGWDQTKRHVPQSRLLGGVSGAAS